jgi:hypothetical protein
LANGFGGEDGELILYHYYQWGIDNDRKEAYTNYKMNIIKYTINQRRLDSSP